MAEETEQERKLRELREEFEKIAKEMNEDIRKKKLLYKGKDGKDYYDYDELQRANENYDEYMNPKKHV